MNQSFIKPLNQATFPKQPERNQLQTGHEGTLKDQMECEHTPLKHNEAQKNVSFALNEQEMMNVYLNANKDHDKAMYSEPKKPRMQPNIGFDAGRKVHNDVRSSRKKRHKEEGVPVSNINQARGPETFQNVHPHFEVEDPLFAFENKPETPRLADLEPNQNSTGDQSKTLQIADQKPRPNFSKTKYLLASFYQNVNELPQKTQEKLDNIQEPDRWNLGIDETLEFFGQLPSTAMDPEEYLSEENYNIQPQEIDLPNDIIEEFKAKIEKSTKKLHQNLRDVNDLFIFSQKVGRLFGDKTNQTIHQSKQISGAFSNLSNYIWDYIQKQFNFTDSDISQEFSLSFQDVAEKITSQHFFSEVNCNQEIGALLNSFRNLMLDENYKEPIEDLKKFSNEMAMYGILDNDLANSLFGEGFEFSADLVLPQEKNQEEEEFKNQYMTISQDLVQFSKNQMEEENKAYQIEQQLRTLKESQSQSEESQEIQEEQKVEMLQRNLQKDFAELNLQRSAQTNPQTTQLTATRTSLTNQSEYNIFQHSNVDFEDGFTPMGFDDVNYMGGFPFGLEDQFRLGNSIDTEVEEDNE